MVIVTVFLLLAALACSILSLSTNKVHPSVAVLLLCVLEALRVLPR